MSGPGVVRQRPLAALAAAALFVCACLLAAAWAGERELAERIAEAGSATPGAVAAEKR